MAFAAGVAAATASKTGAIGGIFGTPLGPLLRFENGFKAGARHAVPTVTVETQFIHDFAALDKGAAVAEFMHVERNVDVIFGAAGGTSIGALNWCLDNEGEERGERDRRGETKRPAKNPGDLHLKSSSSITRVAGAPPCFTTYLCRVCGPLFTPCLSQCLPLGLTLIR